MHTAAGRLAGAFGRVVLGEHSPASEAQTSVATDNTTVAVVGGALEQRNTDDRLLIPQHVELGERARTGLPLAAFRQDATYLQVFWAMREWLVASAIGERLRVQSPFEQRLNAGKLEIAARLASQATLSVGARLERDQLTGRISKSLLLQAALKTVN